MTIPSINPLSKEIQKELQDKINFKTKPLGALGILETIALQIGTIQNTLTPIITKPTVIVFVGDHGIVKSKPVSPYPQEVTEQMVLNFLNEGAAINVFCKQNKLFLKIVDAGVNADFNTTSNLIDAKIAKGTQDYSIGKAMTKTQYELAINKGREIVENTFNEGSNCIGFGEMGIGNTSSASLLMHYFTNENIEDCVGKGTGLTNQGVQDKATILQEVFDLHSDTIHTPMDALTSFSGFEITMITGAILTAASLKMSLIIDGFIVTSALLAAHAIDKNVLDYCIFSHTSGEQGHERMLSFLNATPILNLGLRLGEGTGVAIAFPIINSAIQFLNNMATFKSANVSEA